MKTYDEDTMNILLRFLDNKANKALKEIEETGKLSEENAIPLILKTQFNHIAHLDGELTLFREMVDKRFERMDQRFERMEEKFEGKFARIYTFLGIGFTVLVTLITIFQFMG